MRLAALDAYLRTPHLDRRRATAILRLAFVAMFAAQTVLALAVGIVVRLATRLPPPSTSLLTWILVVLAALELPLGALLGTLAGRHPGRSAALSGSLMLGVVLATPAWFTALALATGQRGLPLLVLWSCLALAYGLGFLLTGRLAAGAVLGEPIGAGTARDRPREP